jgi:hypothetical protein
MAGKRQGLNALIWTIVQLLFICDVTNTTLSWFLHWLRALAARTPTQRFPAS